MASEVKIKQGTKLAMGFDVPAGKEPQFNLVCTFFKSLNEASFLVSIPMKDGKPLKVDENQKLLIRYDAGAAPMIIAGYVDETVKQGIRTYWKIRRVTEQRNFFERADERLKLTVRVEYTQPTWPANIDGVVEPEEGLTLDISAGGLAMYLPRHFEIGELCEVTLPNMGRAKAGQSITVIGENCWSRTAPKGSPYKNICGLKFNFSDQRDKKRVDDYIKNAKKYTS